MIGDGGGVTAVCKTVPLRSTLQVRILYHPPKFWVRNKERKTLVVKGNNISIFVRPIWVVWQDINEQTEKG